MDGYDILEDPMEAKRSIGYLPEQPPLYMDMTVDEYLQFICDIKQRAQEPAGKAISTRSASWCASPTCASA